MRTGSNVKLPSKTIGLANKSTVLPPGHEIISAIGLGAHFWSQSGKIDVRLVDGSAEMYFIKVLRVLVSENDTFLTLVQMSQTEVGRLMARGEYESMKALATYTDLVPKPIGYGTFKSDTNIHFVLREFVDTIDELPDMVDFCQRIADLHRRSLGQAPDHKFGFHVTTCNETIPQYTTPNISWESFYTEALKELSKQEELIHGFSQEISDLLPALYQKVCPRLLRPLETDGNHIEPVLCHGDLWDETVAVHSVTGNTYVFDSSALWAHNEYDHFSWRGERFRLRKAYIREYFNHFPISAPEDDWDDRNLLYSLTAELQDSILYRNTDDFRQLVVRTLKELVEKFPNGYEGPAQQKGTVEYADTDRPQEQTLHPQETEASQRDSSDISEVRNESELQHTVTEAVPEPVMNEPDQST